MGTPPFRLFVLRHAHSSWALPGQRDHQRELDERGREDAERLARAIAVEAIAIDRVHCSTAIRAKETFEIVRPSLASVGETVWSDDLYALGPEAYAAAMGADARARSVLLVGHNPMIEDFALSLTKEGSDAHAKLREGLPTAGFVEFACETGWDAMREGEGAMERLLLPREIAF